MNCEQTKLRWQGHKFQDRNFRTFLYDGAYYKALLPTAEDWLLSPNSASLFKALNSTGFMPRLDKTELQVQGTVSVYRQESEYFNVGPEYFSPRMVKDAALLYIDLCLYLSRKGLGLIDGHSDNFIVQGDCRIKWCDVGSIIKLHDKNHYTGINEFLHYLVFPLLLREKCSSLGDIFRYIVKKGLSQQTFAELGAVHPLLKPDERRETVFFRLRERISAIEAGYAPSAWGGYRDPWLKEETPGPRMALFDKIVAALTPASAVDVGANSGRFSRRLAETGCEVLSIDYNEEAVDRHYAYLRGQNSPLKLKLMVAPFGVIPERTGELACALALSHHLFLSQKYPWPYIAEKMAAYTSRHLLTEFMPHGLSITGPPDSLPANYSLEQFSAQLRRYFDEVEIFDEIIDRESSGAPRIFLCCTNKRAVPREPELPYFYAGLPD